MLVIRRRPGESIRVGADIEIEVMECGANRVKLGIRAPREIGVWRKEASGAREQNIAAAGWKRSPEFPQLAIPPHWDGCGISRLMSRKRP